MSGQHPSLEKKLEQVWKDLGFLFLKRSSIVLVLLVANIYGHDYSLFLLSVDGAILNRYKTIVERILKARLVYGSPNMNRAVSFEYMNRQLVWNEFSEMLLLLLPLLNSSSVKKFLLPFSKDKSAGSSGDEADCPICRSSPSIPFIALPCQHRYCYYCLCTHCSATSSYRCPRCNEVVVAIQGQGLGYFTSWVRKNILAHLHSHRQAALWPFFYTVRCFDARLKPSLERGVKNELITVKFMYNSKRALRIHILTCTCICFKQGQNFDAINQSLVY